jgi:hypothetical protein
MTDVPSVAFFLAALEAYSRIGETRSPWARLMAPLWTALAFQTSYQTLFLLPLLALYTRLFEKRWMDYLQTAVPGLLLLVPTIFLFWRQGGGFHPLTALNWFGMNPLSDPSRILNNTVGNLCVLGGATIFPLGLMAGFWKNAPRRTSLFAGALLAAALLVAFLIGSYPAGSKMLFALFVTAALSACLGLGQEALPAWKKGRAPEEKFLQAWFWGFLVLATIFLPYGVSRYLLPLLFPWSVLFVRNWGKKGLRLEAVVAATLLLGVGVAAGDWAAADAPRHLAELVPPQAPNRYWTDEEAGPRYYFEERGVRYLLNSGEGLKDGDIVLGRATGRLPDKIKQRLEPAGLWSATTFWPIRTRSSALRADFYSSAHYKLGSGFLPYVFSTEPLLLVPLHRYHEADLRGR